MAAIRQTAEQADPHAGASRGSSLIQYALIAGPVLVALALAAVLILTAR